MEPKIGSDTRPKTKKNNSMGKYDASKFGLFDKS